MCGSDYRCENCYRSRRKLTHSPRERRAVRRRCGFYVRVKYKNRTEKIHPVSSGGQERVGLEARAAAVPQPQPLTVNFGLRL